ncbi:MAG: LD-carboxypeptidase [Alphaproteobacteria bacterium]|nr:LD-carboxypeptidase [Alphaproteobacteria bacterium]
MLKKNNQIALIAPSGWFEKKDIEKSIKWFEKQGLTPVVSKHAYDVDFYAAGTPQNRAKDINVAFSRNDIKAVFCIRGGAGSLKTLDFIDYELIQKNKKPLFGLSDSTALQNAIYTKTKNISYTGFLPVFDFKTGKIDTRVEQSLTDIFQNKTQEVKDFDVLKHGQCEGILIGGCLSVFLSLCGTPYFPNLRNKIILIEDVSEKTYRIDLMLQQLKMQKGFDQIKGLIFGQFAKCVEADAGDGSIDDIIKNFAKDIEKPVVYNFPYGHIQSRVLMPIGKKIKIKTTSSITF